MRVISLVPSLTETLLVNGVQVVGRTRFCIHPAASVADVPVVGGTKGVDWQRCAQLKPDLVIFDREENNQEMALECPFPWHAMHIESIDGCAAEFSELADILGNDQLNAHAQQWAELADTQNLTEPNWEAIPGLMAPLKPVAEPIEHVEYLIWRNPWMAIGQQTYIYSVLEKLGFAAYLPAHTSKYPQLQEPQLRKPGTFLLFSSEPYRFMRYHNELTEQGFQGAIVDGELYSWFGVRSLNAITNYLDSGAKYAAHP